MPSPTLTRRALLAGAGTTIASAAIAGPYVNAAHSNDVCSLPAAPEDITARVDRLSRELSSAMGEYLNGDWKITISAGNEVSLQPRLTRSPRHRAEIYLANYRKAMMEADPSITGWHVSYSVDSGLLSHISADRARA